MRHIKIYVSFIFFLIIILITKSNYAADKREGIENFPDSYKPYLYELQKKHPNWIFTALYIDLDWEYVIDNENIFGKNLVPKSYSDRWKNTTSGEYNVEVDSGWVDCSRRAIEYAMDPRNFLNEVRIFQFEDLSYNEKTNNIEGIEKILYGTEFYNTLVDYLDSDGNKITTSSKYSDLISAAGKTSKVSSFHLASRIKQEVGPFLSHSSISGDVEGFEGLYNFYNIGATSSSEPMGAIRNGLQYAKDGKGASETTKTKYLIPWITKERAITGGAIFIGSSYIHLGQDTVYLQKFHVSSNSNGELFWHQYMTNVLAPYSEAKSIYNGYVNSGMLDDSINFIIPVYNNMPDTPTENPNILESDFTEDNTKVYADVSTTLNIRTGPSTSYESITTVDRNEVITRIAKGNQSGELWDKVQLSNGIIGYAFQGYLKEIPESQVEQINLSIDKTTIEKGETVKLNVEILPDDAKDSEIEYISSDSTIASIDSSGNILGIKSGKVTITVKAKENDVSSSIDIEVYTSLEDIELNVQDLKLEEGETFSISPIFYPDDASNQNVTYYSEDESIVKVDSTGNITAISQGNTKVIVKSEEGDITKEISITVFVKLQNDEISFSDELNIEGDQISGWDISKLKVSEIKNKISTVYNIEIYNSNEELLGDNELAGTGAIIRIVDDSNVIKMEYKMIIYGDVNGDAKINSVDLLVLQRHILELEKIHDIYIKAGNINKNGKNPNSLDLLLIQRHILGLELIKQ